MLARTFLRLCALEALRPSALLQADGPWPTQAGKFVFDSRLDPIDDLETEKQPIAVVYTEDDNQKKIAQSGPQLYSSTIDLVFEISVIAKWRESSEQQFEIGLAFTDSEIEARLDLLEYQIVHALHFGASGALFRKIARVPFEGGWRSQAHRTSEEGGRLAMRTCTATLKVIESCLTPAPQETPFGFDRLPSPLKAIAVQLGGSSYLAKLAFAVAGDAPVMPNANPLSSVGIAADSRTIDTPVSAETAVNASADNLQGET